MGKRIFVMAFSVIVLFFGIQIMADSATKCEKGFVNKTLKLKNNSLKVCYNSHTGISYNSSIMIFYKDGVFCGYHCNFDGKNCSTGYCNADNCNKENGYTQLTKINDKIYCYNPKTSLAYTSSDISEDIGGDKVFYYNNEKCGYSCDFDGRNCKYGGVCNILDCNTKKGYSEIKKGKCYNPSTKASAPKCDEGFEYNQTINMCENSKTGLSYSTNITQKGAYYKNGLYCNKLCEVNKCATDKGYTQLKQIEKQMGCYNPNTHISYTSDKTFYIDNMECGENCDFDGKNCKYGKSCYDCDKDKGYTQKKSGRCFNPKTQISYEGKNYYSNNKLCGYNCDINGENCQNGACFADECMKKYGYPEFKDGKCYNPKTFLSREVNTIPNQNNTFYYKSSRCGIACDNDGRNCKFAALNIGGYYAIGICNTNKFIQMIQVTECVKKKTEIQFFLPIKIKIFTITVWE